MKASSHCVRARWIFPVDGPPIENGLLQIEAGRVTSVASTSGQEDLDLGDVAVIPGLVNAHTHLEFSDITEPLPPSSGFASWIGSVVRHRRERSAEPRSIVSQGLNECAAGGTSTVGEIASDDVAAEVLRDHSMQGVVFRELIGLGPESVDPQLLVARQHLDAAPLDPPHLVRGLSPHATYTVHPELLEGVVHLLRGRSTPVAMHLAESPEELQLLDRGTGPLVDLLNGFGVWRDGLLPRGTTVLDFLQPLAELRRVLVIHGNYLTTQEMAFLSDRSQFAVVYCPRTHHGFGHAEHPWRELMSRNIRVALGTDSRASNPNLSLWQEIQFLARRHPAVSGATLLELGTLAGARALGVDDMTGSLTPGKWADLCILDLRPALAETSSPEPYRLLLDPATRCVASMHRGCWIGDSSVSRWPVN